MMNEREIERLKKRFIDLVLLIDHVVDGNSDLKALLSQGLTVSLTVSGEVNNKPFEMGIEF